jgi:hypothetical protein
MSMREGITEMEYVDNHVKVPKPYYEFIEAFCQFAGCNIEDIWYNKVIWSIETILQDPGESFIETKRLVEKH